MITRREFLKASLAAAAFSMVPFSCAPGTKEKPIGIQLYSVRDDLKKDFDATMKAVVEIGYKRMEAAGYRDRKFYGKTPKEMKKYMDDLGAWMIGSHTGSPLLAEGDEKGWDFWKKNAEDTAELGCKWIIQAGYPHKDIKSISDVMRLAEQFNRCGEIAKANGLRFAFHNHIHEFHELEGKVPYDVLIENTDKNLVGFQMDTAQLVFGGYKCHDYVNRYPGRFPIWHLKDANPDGKGSTEFGQGMVDFEALFAVAEKAGMEDYIVEQERYNMTPLEAMKYDYDFLMKAAYVK